MTIRSIIILLLTVASTVSSAQIYKTTDEKGNPQYTDTPNPEATDATTVDLQPLNTATPVETRPAAPEIAETNTAATYKTLAISSPENDGIIPNGLSPTTVTATLSPALLEGHKLRLLVNGVAASTGTSTRFVVPTLNRGPNTLQLEVLSGSDRVQSSSTVSIFAYRPGGK